MSQLRISLPNTRYRRLTGLVLGTLLGLVFGLVLQLGDQLALPGVPLYRPPFGPTGNIVMITAGAALLGVLVAWPMSGIKGTFLVAAGSAAVIIIVSLLAARDFGGNLLVHAIMGIFLALPFWGMLVPVFGALRWMIGQQEEAQRDLQPWWRRVPGPLALLVAVGFLATTALVPPQGHDLLQRTHAMLEAAQATGNIPPALSAVDQFAAHRSAPYQLSWESQSIERFRIPRPGRNFDRHSAVIAHYTTGWSLVCLYITAEEPPLCRGFDVLPS